MITLWQNKISRLRSILKNMVKREQHFQSEFNKFLRDTWKKTGVFELKHTRGRDYLPFNEVQEHQIRALLIAKHGVLSYKISDEARGYKPFDCFCMAGVPAYVVIKYPSLFVMIDIDDFVKESKKKAKSLTIRQAMKCMT